jgi:acid phosphatase
MPTYDHVVVVILENKKRSQIVASNGYIKRLGDQGAELTKSRAVTHPSQPNYIALFSGSTQGITDDSCPNALRGRQLAQQLTRHGHSFRAYSEGLPEAGSLVCSSPTGKYRRKHAPWVNFSSFNQTEHQPFSQFPADFESLPTVSFVVPDMCHDMHDCSIATGDRWMKENLDSYAQWAKTHNSLLVVTFDEDDDTSVNRIYTALIGAQVVPGNYGQVVDHYSVLRTLEDMYGLAPLGLAAQAEPITGIWG